MHRCVERSHSVNGNRLRMLLVATCLIGVIASGGCAQMAVKKALKQYKEQLDPSIGKMTKDDYIKAWGPPESTTAVSDGEVCVWRFSYGTRAFASGTQHWAYSTGTQWSHARAHEMYDKLTMTFNRNGVLQTWRAWCQR